MINRQSGKENRKSMRSMKPSIGAKNLPEKTGKFPKKGEGVAAGKAFFKFIYTAQACLYPIFKEKCVSRQKSETHKVEVLKNETVCTFFVKKSIPLFLMFGVLANIEKVF